MNLKTKAIASFSVFLLVSCQGRIEVLNNSISHETKFGGIYINLSIEEFNKKGFTFGDSLTIKFSNGYTLDDLPYYNGYYVDNLQPLLVGYPGYPYIRAGFNNGQDMWEYGKVNESDKADIYLKEKGKFLAIQEALDIHYTDEQGDIPDEVFGNFRSSRLRAEEGELVLLYRPRSPGSRLDKRGQILGKRRP